ncbi:MAG: hypothetical protein ACXVHQ_40605, partial [Solirubrobacteraceae bacterium]
MGPLSGAGWIPSMRVFAAGTLVGGALSLAGLVSSARAVVASFASTGAEQTFVVPAGISSVHIVAVGGKGGGGNPNLGASRGGAGGVATADLAVAGGETLYV